MVITSEIIIHNISALEKAKKDFSILQQYENCNDFNMNHSLKEEAYSFNLRDYIDFIDFIKGTISNKQEVFYRRKIKNKEFQEILVNNAYDEIAKKEFKSKGPATFQKLINSERWHILSGWSNNTRRKKNNIWFNNVSGSEAIIANYLIQNKLNVDEIGRVSKFYTTLLPSVTSTLVNEVNKTNEFIQFLISKISESDIDFKRLNLTYLTKTLQTELQNKILSIDSGEKVKCIDDNGGKFLSLHKIYDVIEKKIDSSTVFGGQILYIKHISDEGSEIWSPYRLFETVKNIRISALDELLKD